MIAPIRRRAAALRKREKCDKENSASALQESEKENATPKGACGSGGASNRTPLGHASVQTQANSEKSGEQPWQACEVVVDAGSEIMLVALHGSVSTREYSACSTKL